MSPEGTFEIEKLFATALVAFALGVAGNVITFFLLNRDRHIRDLERETKRLSYWKAVRELKADDSDELGLSQSQIAALKERLKEDVQRSVDVSMGWHRGANTLAAGAAWLATPAFVINPDTPQYWGAEIGSMLGYWGAMRAIIYRPTYDFCTASRSSSCASITGNSTRS